MKIAIASLAILMAIFIGGIYADALPKSEEKVSCMNSHDTQKRLCLKFQTEAGAIKSWSLEVSLWKAGR